MSTQRILDTGNKILVERPGTRVPQNTFNMSHDVKGSCNFGALVPSFILEAMPKDRLHVQAECLLRLQPLISPVMHRINIRLEMFFVPNRILWSNWEKFISPQSELDIPPALPVFDHLQDGNTVTSSSLADYLGLPNGDMPAGINALPFAAYNKIWHDWYRDEDLAADDVFIPLVDGDNSDEYASIWGVLQSRNWDRDYFTSANPFPQKGPDMVIPADSLNSGNVVLSNGGTGGNVLRRNDGLGLAAAGALSTNVSGHILDSASNVLNLDPEGNLSTPSDMVQSAMGTVEALREAEIFQEFFERDSRGGTRYAETLEQQFDEYGHDDRLQRAEFIGSMIQPVTISEVLNTTGTDDAPQGQMAGHGISVAHGGDGFEYRAPEHGYFIGIMSVLPVTGYFQGIPKHFTRSDRFDFPWPLLAELGEQPILNQEIYNDITTGENEQVWGYVPRYAEMRQQSNRVCGDFQTSLNYWHLARMFSAVPALTNNFIQCLDDDVLNRIFAVIDADADHLLYHWFFKAKVLRSLPLYVQPRI